MGPVALRGAVAVLIVGVGSMGAAFSGAVQPAYAHQLEGVAVNFNAAAAAPVMQITEDEPTAQFHPEGEGDYGYTLVTANPSAANALASLMWPGSAAGNAGTLVEVLGGPSSLSALNDPVQASAATGTTQTHSSLSAPDGSAMAASVDPTGPDDQHATATSSTAGGSLGPAGSVGSSDSTSTIDFDSTTGVLSASASSSASDLDVGGVVHVASVTSSATAKSDGGSQPELSGATTFHDMTVAGEAAYVDGSGVHLGSPGAPAGPAVVDSVDAALSSAGMQVYFTAPHTITVGGTSYYYSASVLFYWAPPGDPSHNSLTLSVGGAAVSVTASAQQDFASTLGDGTDSGATDATGQTGVSSTAVSTAASGQLSPTARGAPLAGADGATGGSPALAPPGGPQAPGGGATLSLPASPSAAASGTTGGGASSPLQAAARLPGGVGVGWWLLAAAAALAGAGLCSRVPRLLQRQAVPACPRAALPGSTFGNGRKPR